MVGFLYLFIRQFRVGQLTTTRYVLIPSPMSIPLEILCHALWPTDLKMSLQNSILDRQQITTDSEVITSTHERITWRNVLNIYFILYCLYVLRLFIRENMLRGYDDRWSSFQIAWRNVREFCVNIIRLHKIMGLVFFFFM